VCLFGAFDRLKNGYDVYLHTIKYFKKMYNKKIVKFAIYCANSEKLQNYIEQKFMTEDVFIIDNYYFMNDVIKAVDIIVLPYRYSALPTFFLKALMFNKPVIASETGDFSKIIKNSYNGFIVPVSDFKTISEIILKLIEKQEFYDTISENIKKSNIKLTSDDMIEKHIQLYSRHL
jgi:glycosyltransferase involved in cell wall biosynthesis